MSGIQLTYDAVEDRVLLQSHQDVLQPSWWLSRRALLKIIHSLNSALFAKYETEQILQRVVDGSNSNDSVSSNALNEQGARDDYERYRQGLLEGSTSRMERHSTPVPDANLFPFARIVNVDVQESRSMAMTFSDGGAKGLRLEFQEEGLQLFVQMCAELVRQCQW